MRQYLRLFLFGTLAFAVLLALGVFVVDEPLATIVHQHGALLQPVASPLMRGVDWMQEHFFYHGLPIGWLGLLLAFVVTRLLRQPSSTVWLVSLLTVIGSEAAGNLLKLFFNRPRPLDVWSQTAPDAAFWQPIGRFDAFPSGHTAWVAGLLLPIALRFPKLRPVLLVVVGLVALGRVALGVHWFSDVVAAVYLALLLTCGFEIGTWWLRPRASVQLTPEARHAT
ncbi:phosphatase PAP2 family protein [Hymenobacter tenuis]